MDTITVIDTLKVINVSPPITIKEALLQPEYIIASIAVIISIAALIITLVWNRKTYNLRKEHSILSVKPILSIFCGESDNHYIVSLNNVRLEPLF